MVWKAGSGELVTEFEGGSPVLATSFSPDGKHLAVVCVKEMSIWNLETKEKFAAVPDAGMLDHFQYDPSGRRLGGVSGGSVKLWDVASLAKSASAPKQIPLKAEEVHAFSFSPDGSKFAAAGERDSAVWIYDVQTGQELNQLDVK